MSNELSIMETVLIKGDVSKLTPEERSTYYLKMCESLGLNPLTKPFEYVELKKGELTLYARKDCTDQLRKIHNVSLKITDRQLVDDCYTVSVMATDSSGRTDEATGVVSFAGRRKDFNTGKWIEYVLKGEERANAMMKAETKAKRRVTLSIAGLGMLDEHEVSTIPNAVIGEPQQALPRHHPADPILFEPIVSKPMSEKTYHAICDYMGFIDVKADTLSNWLAKGGVDSLERLTEEQGQAIIQWFVKQEEKMNNEMQSQNTAWNCDEATA